MQRMYARRRAVREVTAGTDKVLFGISLPSDTKIGNIRARIALHGSAVRLFTQAIAYGVEGWILPVLDPDTPVTLDVLWDQLVPKDTDSETLDLDTGATDATPFFEPGEADWSQMLDVGLRPQRVYQRLRMRSMGSGDAWNLSSSDVPQWIPRDTFEINISKPMRVKQPSALVFAMASPAMDDDITTQESVLAESEWGQIKYATELVERAQLDLLGIGVPGSVTMWDLATKLLQKHLEPDMVEESTAITFVSATYLVLVDALIDHSVVGSLETQAITTGR